MIGDKGQRRMLEDNPSLAPQGLGDLPLDDFGGDHLASGGELVIDAARAQRLEIV